MKAGCRRRDVKGARRLVSFVVAAAMALSLVVTAVGITGYAASSSDTEGSITITNPEVGVKYYVYKIFDLTYSSTDTTDEDGNTTTTDNTSAYAYTISTDSDWFDLLTGHGADSGDSTASTYQSSYVIESMGVTLTRSASDSSVYIVTVTTDEDDEEDSSSLSESWGSLIAAYLKGLAGTSTGEDGTSTYSLNSSPSAEASASVSTTTDDDGTTSKSLSSDSSNTASYYSSTGYLTFSGLELGYYLVIGSNAGLVELTNTAADAYITDKNDVELEKTDDAVDVEVGDTVNYTITGQVPDAIGFDSQDTPGVYVEYDANANPYYEYKYELTDEMSAGLTLDGYGTASVISIKLVDPDSTEASDEEKTGESDTSVSLTLSAVTNEDGSTSTTTSSTDSDGNPCSIETCTYSVQLDSTNIGLLYVRKTTTNGSESSVITYSFTLSLDATLLTQYIGWDIVITYSATVNDDAVTVISENEVTLDYTNNYGETTDVSEKSTVYSARISVYKYEADDKKNEDEEDEGDDADSTSTGTPLEGAVFVLYRICATSSDGETTLYLTEATDEDGSKLTDTDGYQIYQYTYTDDDGEEQTVKLYYSTADSDGNAIYSTSSSESSDDSSGSSAVTYTVVEKYYKYTAADADTGTAASVTWVSGSEVDTTDDYGNTVSYGGVTKVTTGSDGNGTTSFDGLEYGVYYLLEIEAPDGYNLCTDSTEVTVNTTLDLDEEDAYTDTNVSSVEAALSKTVEIENTTGTLLPSTGGVGTTIFYIAGVALIAGAVVIFFVRRRRDRA